METNVVSGCMPLYIYVYKFDFLRLLGMEFVTVLILTLLAKYSEYNSSPNCTLCSYIQHCVVGDRNKFASCKFEPLIGCSNDEDQTALK